MLTRHFQNDSPNKALHSDGDFRCRFNPAGELSRLTHTLRFAPARLDDEPAAHLAPVGFALINNLEN